MTQIKFTGITESREKGMAEKMSLQMTARKLS